jgi:hypothetical protein
VLREIGLRGGNQFYIGLERLIDGISPRPSGRGERKAGSSD